MCTLHIYVLTIVVDDDLSNQISMIKWYTWGYSDFILLDMEINGIQVPKTNFIIGWGV